jgi:hypothetical protein
MNSQENYSYRPASLQKTEDFEQLDQSPKSIAWEFFTGDSFPHAMRKKWNLDKTPMVA